MSKTFELGSTRKTFATSLRERIQFTPFWKITDWGCSFWPLHHIFNATKDFSWGPLKLVDLGCDEWHNPSMFFVVPLVGQLTIFYGWDIDRTKWFLQGSRNRTVHYISPDYKFEAHLHYSGDFQALFEWMPLLTTEQVRKYAYRIESTSRDDNVTILFAQQVGELPGPPRR